MSDRGELRDDAYALQRCEIWQPLGKWPKTASTVENWGMRQRLRSYTTYSVACFVVWAAIWIVRTVNGWGDDNGTIRLIFVGWVIGWLSATIARSVYPPPKPRSKG